MVLTSGAVLTGVVLAAGTIFFARRRPEYRHVRHTISELGESGARDARLVGFALFLPVGLASAAIGWFTRSEGALSAALSTLSLAVAVGYLAAAVFPCDPGSPLTGTWRQGLHNVGGGIEYVGGAVGLWRVGEAATSKDGSGVLAAAFGAGAVVVALVAVALSFAALARWRGGIQRVGEFILFGGLASAAWLLEIGEPAAS